MNFHNLILLLYYSSIICLHTGIMIRCQLLFSSDPGATMVFKESSLYFILIYLLLVMMKRFFILKQHKKKVYYMISISHYMAVFFFLGALFSHKSSFPQNKKKDVFGQKISRTQSLAI